MESILNSTKRFIGPTTEYEYFDTEIIMHINTVFVILTQMGVGPANGFSIEDDSAKWTDFISDDHWFFHSLKTYMGAKVKLIFDPPSSSSHKEALQRIVDELEWRLHFANDTGDTTSSEDSGSFDYNNLVNKPTINGQPLVGNYDERDPVAQTLIGDVDAALGSIIEIQNSLMEASKQ